MTKTEAPPEGLLHVRPEKTLQQRWWYPIWRIFRGTLPKHDAFYALLAAAVMIDGKSSKEELAELNALTGRTKTLSKLPPAKMEEIRKRIRPRLDGDKIHMLIDQACDSLGKDWGASVYAHAADIVFADRRIPPSEQQFLVLVAEKLKVPPPLAEKILLKLRIKNEHYGDEARTVTPTSQPSAEGGYGSLGKSVFAGLSGSLTKEEALYAILALAVYADESERPEETAEVDAIAQRTKTLHGLSQKALADIHNAIWPQVAKDKREALFENACESLPAYMRLAAFAHAADLTFADRKVVDAEKRFLQRLAERLRIQISDAEDMLQVLEIKNRR
jgi:uncharacterized tellurite resistance protein B-like protein